MNRSTFWMIVYMNGSVFSKARYINGVGFEILARTLVSQLSPSYHPPPLPRGCKFFALRVAIFEMKSKLFLLRIYPFETENKLVPVRVSPAEIQSNFFPLRVSTFKKRTNCFLNTFIAEDWSRLFHPWIWTCPLMQTEVSVWNQNHMTNSVDLDETARNEPSHLDLHCLHRYLFGLPGSKG